MKANTFLILLVNFIDLFLLIKCDRKNSLSWYFGSVFSLSVFRKYLFLPLTIVMNSRHPFQPKVLDFHSYAYHSIKMRSVSKLLDQILSFWKI